MPHTELPRLLDQLERAFHSDAWSGPSLLATLIGLSAEQAAARPIPPAHSIWELVLHLRTWAATASARIEQRYHVLIEGEDWPAVPLVADEVAWQTALAELSKAHERLLTAVQALHDKDLNEVLGAERNRPDGSGVSIYVLLHGTAQHYLYHAGQVALLRKLV
ncbi:DinB family protein [Hymenobacter jeollabukensis]|uniref:DinB family protein n=1 Tax=Hymenobacter jeollabukensis TaxID=2025313 RepID=A0A5R8WM98_9BACT|nr:DinB family protein [Hymenobacter jeollabukensis]TLM90513.1 DinB family protein [Hymenobacter jeollabukensis]